MGRAFGEGIVAGYGIAVPVGAIAVLIVDVAMRRGLPSGMAAGAGAATADLLYATVAMVGGTAIATVLEPVGAPLRFVSALVLLAIAAAGVLRAVRTRPRSTAPTRGRGLARTFAAFLGLTILNPLTVVYFVALILGLRQGALAAAPEKSLFVAGAFLASLSWQWIIAGAGAWMRHRLSERARIVTGLAGSLIVAALAVRILLQS